MSKGIKTWFLIAVALPAFAATSYFSWVGTKADYAALEPGPPRPTQVNWFRVRRELISDWIRAEGTARAVKKVHLAFEVEGRVAEIMQVPGDDPLREGVRVRGPQPGQDQSRKGQLIASLDGKDYAEDLRIAQTEKVRAEHAVEIADAQLRQSQSSERLARVRLERIQRLLAKKVTPKQEHDEAKSQVDLARAAVASATAELAAAKAAVEAAAEAVARASRNFERTRIYAPWSGQIARLNIREGEYVSPEILDTSDVDAMTATFPVTLIDTSAFEVSVELPKFNISGLAPGNDALVRRQNTSASAAVSPVDDWIPAAVYTVAPILSPRSGTVRVRLRTKGAQPALLDGELLQTKTLRERKEALVVPVNALIHRDNKATVFVVMPDNERVRLQEVRTGIREKNRIEVVSGLAQDDLVVTEGRQRLMEGDRVSLLDQSPPLLPDLTAAGEEVRKRPPRNSSQSQGEHHE